MPQGILDYAMMCIRDVRDLPPLICSRRIPDLGIHCEMGTRKAMNQGPGEPCQPQTSNGWSRASESAKLRRVSVFLNMTTNSRGMLVIGVAVAAFVLAGFSALYSTGSEKSMGTGKSIEGQLKEQAKEISLNRDTIRERTRQLDDAEKRRSTAREADNLTALVQGNRKRIQELEKQVPTLRQAISGIERNLEEDKQRYRSQLLANPATNAFPELKTLSGKTYRDAHLSSIDGTSITFSHQDGSSRVLLKDLPAEIRNRFP